MPICPRTPGYSVRKNSIRPLSSRQWWRTGGWSSATSQLARAFTFISRSTSTYTMVVLSETWPSQARIVLMSTPARSKCVAVVCRLCLLRHSRHTAAMELLQHGIDRSVIALWLGHESVETTQMYLHADLRLKEQALSKTTPLNAKAERYRPDDKLLAFLEGL